MQRSEIGSLVMWSITLALGILGVLVVIRSWLLGEQTIVQFLYATLAAVASASLAAASVWAWVEGASGEYYDAALGAIWWNTGMIIGLLIGLAIGRLLPIGADDRKIHRTDVAGQKDQNHGDARVQPGDRRK